MPRFYGQQTSSVEVDFFTIEVWKHPRRISLMVNFSRWGWGLLSSRQYKSHAKCSHLYEISPWKWIALFELVWIAFVWTHQESIILALVLSIKLPSVESQILPFSTNMMMCQGHSTAILTGTCIGQTLVELMNTILFVLASGFAHLWILWLLSLTPNSVCSWNCIWLFSNWIGQFLVN